MTEDNRLEYHGLFAVRTDLRGMEALQPQQQIVEAGVFQTNQRRSVLMSIDVLIWSGYRGDGHHTDSFTCHKPDISHAGAALLF